MDPTNLKPNDAETAAHGTTFPRLLLSSTLQVALVLALPCHVSDIAIQETRCHLHSGEVTNGVGLHTA